MQKGFEIVASQLGVMPYGEPLGCTPSISKQRGSSADCNANNSWYFNGTNGCLNNNNRYNTNFRCRPSLDYGQYDNEQLETYLIPLSYLLIISLQSEKGKKRKPSYVFFVLHRIDELVPLCHEINNCEVLPREGTAHIIFEPRVREIVCAASVKKVMQTFYIMQMQPYLEKYMYHPDSYSCRPGKGGLKAVQQLNEYIYEATNGYTELEGVMLAKIDIQAFFMNLDCFQVCAIVTDFIDEYMADHPYKELLKYLTRIIYLAATKDHIKDMASKAERALLDPQKSVLNQPYYKGVPIGDWTSQTAGLIITTGPLRYLASLGYKFVHYTDDTTVIVMCLWRWLEDIERMEIHYKERYGLTLHPKKRYLQHVSKGVELLGFKLRFGRILPSDRIYHNMMWYLERTISKATENSGYAVAYKDKIQESINSYLGLLQHMDAFKLRREICQRVEASPIVVVFEASDDYKKIVIKPEYTTATYYENEYKSLKQQLKINLL